MRILGRNFVRGFRNRIVNIHPALLPAFKGTHGIESAYEYGAKLTGVTVHFVDERLDAGPIILQEAVTIKRAESIASLEERIHALEYELYPKAINLLVKNKLQIKGRRVIVKR